MDLDAYGHVGNSRFFDFMTDARVAAFSDNNFLSDLSLQYVVAETQCTYKKPLYYPGNVIVQQYCEHVGSRSFTLSYTFAMEDEPGVICAAGKVVMVCYDASKQKAVSLPQEIYNSLNNGNSSSINSSTV
jgi:acyl-CoA thioester hydrolase